MYRLLLKLFPRDIRLEFGADMQELFEYHRRRTHGFGAIALWARATGDALVHGLGLRIERLLMDTLAHDVRFAVRTLLKQPAVTAAILLTLGLGIGANTAVFSVVHAVLLRALPYPDPEQLVMIFEKRPAEGVMDNVVSPADYLDWARMSRSFSSMSAYQEGTVELTGAGDPVQLAAGVATPGFFEVLGVRMLHGRTFNAEEAVLGRHRVAILGHRLWTQRFGADANIVGRTVTLSGIAHLVVGVLPPEFESPAGPVEIWGPLVLQEGSTPPPRASHQLFVYARMKPDVAFEQARSEMDALGRQLEAEYPNESRGHGAHVVSLRERIVEPVKQGLIVLTLAVAFVLLIACTNVANLLLARGASRRRELAVRAAVGATRARLLRQSLTESVCLAVASGVVGVGVAVLLVQTLVAQTPPALRGVGLDRASLSPTVLTFAFLLCVVTGVLAGVLPAWLVTRDDLNSPLRDQGRGPSTIKKGVRFALIVAEVSLTSLLLVGAGLLLRSFERVLSQPPGLELGNRLTTTVTLPRARYPDMDGRRRALLEIETRLRGIHGATAVGVTNNLPLSGSDARRGIVVEGFERRPGDAPVRAHPRIVSPDYFRAAGMRMAEGRAFTEADIATAPAVVVVNETMARRYWPNASPVGKRMMFTADAWREVVGVVKDVRHWGLDRVVNPEVYLPFAQQPSATLSVVIHAAGQPEAMAPDVTRAIQDFDRDMPLGPIETMEQVAAQSLASRRWSAVLLGSFAVLALVLAAIGIYGVMSHIVATRTGEIGIRLTLGSRPSRILRDVLREGLMCAAVGLAIGLGVSLAVMRGLSSMLFEVTPADPLTLAGVGIMLLGVSAVACLGPAFRAMRVDPIEALRC
jgi:putative ABC transport system permease protein